MGFFSKKNRVIDERIEVIRNKIYREIYTLTLVICLISVVVKSYLYGVNVGNVATELVIAVVGGIYYMVRSARLGIFSDEVEIHDRNSKVSMDMKNIIIGIVAGVGMALYFGIHSAVAYGDGKHELWYFTLVFFVSLIIYLPFFMLLIVVPYFAARRASEKVSKDDDE